MLFHLTLIKWIIKATRRFEEAGRRFVEETVKVAKFLRPKAQWGYYGFPYCFNMNGKANMDEDCPSNVKDENNQYVSKLLGVGNSSQSFVFL